MRTFGRVTDQYGARYWVEVGPDPNGYLDSIYLTALAQVLQLGYGESPFYGDWGIPAEQSVMTQIAPDYYVSLTQQRFAPYFLFLGVTRVPTPITPTYNITVIFQTGAQDSINVIPQTMVDGNGRPVLDGYGNPISAGSVNGNFVAT